MNAQEGQLLINRYYNMIQQLGMNGSTQIKNFYGNPSLVEEFLSDIAQAYEREVLAFYRVNEAALIETPGYK